MLIPAVVGIGHAARIVTPVILSEVKQCGGLATVVAARQRSGSTKHVVDIAAGAKAVRPTSRQFIIAVDV